MQVFHISFQIAVSVLLSLKLSDSTTKKKRTVFISKETRVFQKHFNHANMPNFTQVGYDYILSQKPKGCISSSSC